MRVTLRKAKALQTAIFEAINTLPIEVNISLGEFDNVGMSISTAQQNFTKNSLLRVELWRADYAIRDLVGQTNVAVGIASKLTEKALLDKLIEDMSGMVSSSAQLKSTDALTGALEKKKNAVPVAGYGYREDTVTTGIFTLDQIEGFKKDLGNLKKQKVKLDDELLELNVRSEIELTEDIVALLKSVNIL